jgi:DNA-binding transcriptional regulator GbsR (MarR family)
MQPNLSQILVRMLVERILADVLPNETGAARLQQVGLFAIIYMMQSDDEPVTITRIANIAGLADTQVSYQLKKLLKVDLVERTKILNKQGRGYAYAITVKYNAKARRLVDAIEKAKKP